MRRYVLVILGTVLLWAGSLSAADGDGGYAGAFLQVPIGARPTAMGGAYLAISNDGAAPFYNPAGITNLRRPLFASSYRLMNLDRKLGYITLIFPTRRYSAIGVHWRYAGSGSVMMRDRDGDPTGTELSHDNNDFSILFAKRFEEYLSAGVKMYYLHSSFAEMTSSSVGFDVGFMLYVNEMFGRERQGLLPVRDIRIGLTLKYVQATYIWNNEKFVHRYYSSSTSATEQEDPVPVEFGIGASARFLKRKLLVAADLLKNMEQGPIFHGGAEYFVRPEFALRGGFSDGSFTAGTGFVIDLVGRVLAIDYAFSTDKASEGSEHMFSFDLLF